MDDRKREENMIREPAQDIPVYREAEVIVAGGGPAGVSAAVAAASVMSRS